MTDRDAALRDLAATLREREPIEDAWLAKSFTDRLLVVDVRRDASFPEELRRTLADRGLRGAGEVYGVDDADDDASFAGAVDGADRHQFVDVRTRGDHRSYVHE